jgi:hypothetical protein
MMDFILSRAKAFIAALAVGVVPVVISAAESASGFDIPASWEAWLLMLVTGLAVYQVPNKKPM